MLIEAYLLVSKLEDMYGRGEFPFQAVPAGSELGEGERYIFLAQWPTWGPLGNLNRPDPGVLLRELEAVGVDMSTIVERDRALGGTIEVVFLPGSPRTGINVKDVQKVFAKYGGLCCIFYKSGTIDAVPEIAWDASDTYQALVEKLHGVDFAWWTKTTAIAIAVLVVLVGVVLVIVFLRRRKG